MQRKSAETPWQSRAETRKRNGVDPTFLEGDLAEPLIQRRIKIDLLLANLPYIATDELALRWK